MYNSSEEFRKYATKHMGISSSTLDKYSSILPNIPVGMTPNIIEERQMNIAVMDVFSRLMMDRIIFLGTAIDDYVANIITAQLLFLESMDAKRDIQIYINSPGGSPVQSHLIYNFIRQQAKKSKKKVIVFAEDVTPIQRKPPRNPFTTAPTPV